MNRNGMICALAVSFLTLASYQTALGKTEKSYLLAANDTIRVGEPNEADLYSLPPIYRDQAIKELGSDSLVDVDDLISKPKLPPSLPTKPVLKHLPSSFVNPVIKVHAKYDSSGVEVEAAPARTVAAQVVINSYLSDHAPTGIGTIEEIETGEKVASLGQNVVVQLRRTASRGEKLSVVYPKDNINIGERSVGPIVENGGNVEIGDTIDENKHVYRAAVTSNVNPIRVNSIVTEAPLQRTDFRRNGTQVSVSSRVIGGEFDEQRRHVGEGSVVYLDAGTNAGWKLGDIVPIQAKRGAHREDTKFPEWLRTIGLLKIVDVEGTVSTAIVLESTEEIAIGDLTGGERPQPLPVLRMESSAPATINIGEPEPSLDLE